mmetsp:Transcript_59171/g.137786  ORF Transcript_59171/g.137786 Transcript_59171/m.137786 type:complete len:323 (+) Transcript_59171:719-1687(+)
MASLEWACLQGKWQELRGYWVGAAKVRLQLVESEVLPQLVNVIDEDKLLCLTLRDNALGHSHERLQHPRHVADVELEHAASEVTGHVLVHLFERLHGHLADAHVCKIAEDIDALNFPRHNHVAQEVFHAEDHDGQDPIIGFLFVPLLRDALCPENHGGSQALVAPAEVCDAMLHILHNGLFCHGLREVVGSPLVGPLHQAQSQLLFHTCLVEVPRCHDGQCGHEQDICRPGLLLHEAQTLSFFLLQLEVTMQLSLLVTVSEMVDDHTIIGLEAERLLWKRKGSYVLLRQQESLALLCCGEAVAQPTTLNALSLAELFRTSSL